MVTKRVLLRLPKHLLCCLLGLASFSPLSAAAQTIGAAGGNVVTVNWRPAAAIDSLRLDLDGDSRPDAALTSTNHPSTGPGVASTRTFSVALRSTSGVEVALDATEYDSAHRYLSGEPLEGNILWQSQGKGFLDYVVVGNGGVGGRGFFRNNAAGFIAFRQRAAGQIRYWWVSIGPRLQAADTWVTYYASSAMPLATPAPASAMWAAFPNPASTAWRLQQPAAFQLFDTQGRLVGSSAVATTVIAAPTLAPGLYELLLYLPTGGTMRQRLQKE